MTFLIGLSHKLVRLRWIHLLHRWYSYRSASAFLLVSTSACLAQLCCLTFLMIIAGLWVQAIFLIFQIFVRLVFDSIIIERAPSLQSPNDNQERKTIKKDNQSKEGTGMHSCPCEGVCLQAKDVAWWSWVIISWQFISFPHFANPFESCHRNDSKSNN